MGNSASSHNYYCTYTEATEPTSTGVLRASTHPNELVKQMPDRGDVQNCWDLLKDGIRKAGRHSPSLGARLKLEDGSLGPFSWMTYGQLETSALSFGSGLFDYNLVPEIECPEESYAPAKKLRFLGVYLKNCRQWVIAEQSCNAYKIALVPLYDTLGQDAIKYILEHTKLTTCVVSSEGAWSLIQALGNIQGEKHLKNLIVVGDINDDLLEQGKKEEIKFLLWTDVSSDSLRPVANPEPQDVNTICYTSGTTGTPKGVILTHAQFISVTAAALRGPLQSPSVALSKEDVHISYLPLPHVFERIFVNVLLFSGGRIGFYSGDVLKLVDDIFHLMPTFFISVPRFYSRINDRIAKTISEKSFVARYLFSTGMSTKLKKLRSEGASAHALWDKLIFSKIAKILGGRLRFLVSGGAPLDLQIQERMQALFCAPLLEGYGLTETMGGSFLRFPGDPVFGHVGGPLPNLEFKVQTVKEMNYLVSDDPPRGELLLRGPSVTPGYYKNIEATQALFVKGNWMLTGDIVMLLPTNGVKIIDRKKAIFKLSQGEYVAPEKIEGIYGKASMVSQIFMHGDSYQNCLVAIVIPDEEIGEIWWKENKQPGNFSIDTASKNETFKLAVLSSMREVEKELKGFEKAKMIHLGYEPFSPENGLLTPTFKIRRNELKKIYEGAINKMYETITAS